MHGKIGVNYENILGQVASKTPVPIVMSSPPYFSIHDSQIDIQLGVYGPNLRVFG